MNIRSIFAIAMLTAAPLHAQGELFGAGWMSTGLDELNTVFSPDGREVYWTLNGYENSGWGVIVFARRDGDGWSAPQVASFSGQYTDYDPFFSADGRRLFFISNRPGPGKQFNWQDFDVWVTDRAGTGWSEPRNLGAPVNSPGPEYYPSVAADGTMYFSALLPGSAGFDVFRSRLVNGQYQEPERLGPGVNPDRPAQGPPTAEIDNYIAPDQSFIIFASYGRADAMSQQGDLYISYQVDGEWTPAQNLGDLVNSPGREYCPIGSPDGEWFYWTSKRGFNTRPPLAERVTTYDEAVARLHDAGNGGGDIYRVRMSEIHARFRP